MCGDCCAKCVWKWEAGRVGVGGYGETTGRKRGTPRQNRGMRDTKAFQEDASISVEKSYETRIKVTKFE